MDTIIAAVGRELLTAEMNADLGDQRRSRRLQKIVNVLASNPDRSFPEVFTGPGDLEGLYRFVRNKHFGFDEVIAPHYEGTVRRAEALGEVLVIHDSTEFNFKVYGQEAREHLCQLSKTRQGFFGHASLVASADGLRAPLGVVGFRPYVHINDLDSEESRQWWDERGGVMESEQERWHDAVANADKALRRVHTVIHVMDREADDYDLLADMRARDDRFVVRCAYDRRVELPDGTGSKLFAALDNKPFVATRTVELSARELNDRPANNRRSHPPRKRRDATLSFRARSIVVRRPDKASNEWPNSLQLNVVEAVELSPPDGEVRVRWVLLTTDPVDPVDDILLVVDRYRSRWLVEESFKATKTGCAYEKRQMESATTLLLMLGRGYRKMLDLEAALGLFRQAGELPSDGEPSNSEAAGGG